MKPLMIAGVALALTACAPFANTTRTLYTSPVFDEYIITNPQYPVVIEGADAVGLTPNALAQSMRYPYRMRSGSAFRAVNHTPDLVDHGHVNVTAAGENATAVLSFRNGEREIAAGSFTLKRADFQNPEAVGSSTAILIETLLQEAREELRESDKIIWIPN